MHDSYGHRVAFLVLDLKRRGSDGWGYWRVATFLDHREAERFLVDADRPSYFIECVRATAGHLSLARDVK